MGEAEIPVKREHGADGEISVKWRTIDKSAVNGKDFMGGEGILEFKNGEVRNEPFMDILGNVPPPERSDWPSSRNT